MNRCFQKILNLDHITKKDLLKTMGSAGSEALMVVVAFYCINLRRFYFPWEVIISPSYKILGILLLLFGR